MIYSRNLGRRAARARHLAPLVATLLFGLLLVATLFYPMVLYAPALAATLYASAVLAASVIQAFRHWDVRLFPLLVTVFTARHLLYAAGSLCAVVQTARSWRFWQSFVLRHPIQPEQTKR